MSNSNEDRINKLPVWARDEIRFLRRKVEELQAKLATGPEDSNTFLWNGGFDGALDTPLGQDAVIRFDDAFDVHLKDGRLEVRGVKFGREGLVVRPHVTNVVSIEAERG